MSAALPLTLLALLQAIEGTPVATPYFAISTPSGYEFLKRPVVDEVYYTLQPVTQDQWPSMSIMVTFAVGPASHGRKAKQERGTVANQAGQWRVWDDKDPQGDPARHWEMLFRRQTNADIFRCVSVLISARPDQSIDSLLAAAASIKPTSEWKQVDQCK